MRTDRIQLNLKLLAAVVVALVTTGAAAHDFWLDGSAVDPATKRVCCGAKDARIVDPSRVHVTARGYKLDDTQETIPFARVQPSPDGRIWAFRWAAMTQCFFMPPEQM